MRIASLVVLAALLSVEPVVAYADASGSGKAAPVNWRFWRRKQPSPPPEPPQPRPDDVVRERDRRAAGQTTWTPGLTGSQSGGTQQHPSRVGVRLERHGKSKVRSGESTKLTWTVTGTTEPIRLRVRNIHPHTGKLHGGDVQEVMTSGGTPNFVTVTALGLAPGGVDLQVDVDVDEDDVVARTFRRELNRIAAEVELRANTLLERHGTGGVVPKDAVVRVLNEAVADIERSLPFDALEPFRDGVREHVNELKQQVMETRIAEESHAAIQLVRQPAPEGRKVPTTTARAIFSGFVDWIRGIGNAGPRVEICVFTVPTNDATLLLYPIKATNHEPQRTTPARFTVYVGLYTWEVAMNNYLAGKGSVNFLTDPDRVVECRLRRTATDPHVCEPILGALDGRCRQ